MVLRGLGKNLKVLKCTHHVLNVELIRMLER